MTDTTDKIYLDDYFQTTPIGSIELAMGNDLYGINHRQVPGAVLSSTEMYGYTFFVRPQLNMQSNNLRNIRKLIPLMNNSPTSIQRYTKCMLDPRMMHGYGSLENRIPAIDCPLVDNENAFIPVMTNNLKTLSGWPDPVAEFFTSKKGLYGEVYSQVDSNSEIFGEFDITATFRNTLNDPILHMLSTWLIYQTKVFEGTLAPYPDYVVENEIDYNTRIYRLVMSKNKSNVVKIAATGASFLAATPIGAFFDYTNEQPYNNGMKEFSIRFHSLGATYNDDILVYEFNKTVEIFNPSMKDNVRLTEMIEIPASALMYFNNRGYPRIEYETYHLGWWVKRSYYQQRLDAITPILSPHL